MHIIIIPPHAFAASLNEKDRGSLMVTSGKRVDVPSDSCMTEYDRHRIASVRPFNRRYPHSESISSKLLQWGVSAISQQFNE